MSVLTWRARKREFFFLGEGFEESQIRKSLKVVSEGSGASLKGKRRGTWRVGEEEEEEEEEDEKESHAGRGRRRARSLLRKVRSDGEAGCPERSHAEDRLDGGPGAAEDGVPLPVVQLDKGLLGERQEEKDRQLLGLSKSMCLPLCVFLHQLLSDGSNENTTQDQTGILFIPSEESESLKETQYTHLQVHHFTLG